MCVAISMEPGTELTLEEIIKMGRANADGVGIAWAEDGQVHWFKTIQYVPEYILKIINERVGFFRLVHFRLSTAGGVKVELCHPFEIGPLANSSPRGHSSKVLIHNGHWHRWTDVADILVKEDLLPDRGPWSDSRLAAFLASIDEDWLDVVTGRVATMDGDGNTKLLGAWETLRPGLKVSNKVWDNYSTTQKWSRSGRDRDWAGWGWTEEQWKQKEAWDKQQADKTAKEAKADGKEKEEASQVQGQTPGEVRVGVQPGDTGVGAAQAAKGAKGGGNSGGASGRSVYQKAAGLGAGGVGEDQKVSVKANEVIYDHTPWFNKETKRWYHIPRNSVHGTYYRVEELTEGEARSILESLAAPTNGAATQP